MITRQFQWVIRVEYDNHLWHKPTVLTAWDDAIIHFNPLPHPGRALHLAPSCPDVLMAAVPVIFVAGWIVWHLGPPLENLWILVCGWIFYLCIFRWDFLQGSFMSFSQTGRFEANRFLFGRSSHYLSISFWKRHKSQSQPTRANVELPTAKWTRMNLDVDYRAQKNGTHNILVCWVYNIYICRFMIYIDRFRLGINLYLNLHIHIYIYTCHHFFLQHVFQSKLLIRTGCLWTCNTWSWPHQSTLLGGIATEEVRKDWDGSHDPLDPLTKPRF